MKRLHKVLATAAMGTAAGVSAPSTAEMFTGGYIGIEADLGSSVTFERTYKQAFQDFVEDHDPDLDDGDLDELVTSRQFGMESVLPGGALFLGGGTQQGGLYYGLEARYQFGGHDDGFAADGLDEDASLELEDGYSVSGRVGTVLRDGNVLLYGSLGYAEREVTFELDEPSDTNDHTGYRTAVGLEYRPTDLPMLVRLEASRSDYGDETYTHEGQDIVDIDDLTEYAAHLGVGYTFF